MEAAMRLRQVAVVLTAFTLAGCGAARPGGTGPGGKPAALVTVSRRGGPPGTTRAAALRLAGRLIAENVLPPGARRLPQQPVPPLLRQVMGPIGVTAMVDIYHLFTLPVSMRRAEAFLIRHAPAGMHGGQAGNAGGPNGPWEMAVSYAPDRLPRGISSASLGDTIVPAPHGGSLLRQDAQVVWYPPRSAAEYIAVRDYRAVRVDAWLLNPYRHVTRSFTSPGVIGRLARLLNSLPASSGGMYSCPIEAATYRLTFEAVSGQPDVVVGADGCAVDTISVGGARQPALADFGKLIALTGKIMRVRDHATP
jgi:hypothetical protein